MVPHEAFDMGRQHVAGMGVDGRHGHLARDPGSLFTRDAGKVVGAAQHAFDDGHERTPGRGEAGNAPPVADEQRDAEVTFEQLEVPGQAWLRCVQPFRGSRQVQALGHDFLRRAELMQLHGGVHMPGGHSKIRFTHFYASEASA